MTAPFPSPLLPILGALLTIGVLSPSARAQINIEKMRLYQEQGFSVSLGTSFSLESGNSDTYEIGVDGRVDYLNERHYLFLVGLVRYGEENDRVFRNRTFAHLRYTHRLPSMLALEAFTQAEQNEFTLLQLRLLGVDAAGGGAHRGRLLGFRRVEC